MNPIKSSLPNRNQQNGHYASLRTTVDHLAAAYEQIAVEIRGINVRLDQVGRPDWKAYGTWGALVVTAWIAVFTVTTSFTDLRIAPMDNVIAKLEEATRLGLNNAAAANKETGEVAHEERVELHDDLVALRASIFPNGVHEQRWQLYDTKIDALDRELIGLSTRLGDLYNPADKLKELQEQIDTLRALLSGYRKPMSDGGVLP